MEKQITMSYQEYQEMEQMKKDLEQVTFNLFEVERVCNGVLGFLRPRMKKKSY